jgi:hypothetical protein
MIWAVEILRFEAGKPPTIIDRLEHAADSIEEVKASMRAMLDTPDWPEQANGFRILGGDEEELFCWP